MAYMIYYYLRKVFVGKSNNENITCLYNLITSAQIRQFGGNYICGLTLKKVNPGYYFKNCHNGMEPK